MNSLRICNEKYSSVKQIKVIDNKYKSSKYKAAFLKNFIWKSDSEIKIKFLEDIKNITWTPIPDLQKENRPIDPLEYEVRKLSPKMAVIKTVKERIIPIVGLNIIFVDSGNADVRVSFDQSSGSWSLIGTDCKNIKDENEATINFGWLDVGTIIHEFGHVLGMIHEHQNSFDNKIEWDKNKVLRWARETQGWDDQMVYTNILDRYNQTTLNGTDFDKCSIMLYFFPASLTVNNVGTNQNNILSSNDVSYISKIYPGGSISPSRFYKNVYKEDLFSNKLCGKSLDNNNKKGKVFLKIFFIIFVSLLMLVLIISIYKYKYR